MKSAWLFSSLFLASVAQADVFGLTAETGMFLSNADIEFSDSGSNSASSNLDSDNIYYYGIAIEHPIPLFPNVRLQSTPLKANGSASTTLNGNAVSGSAKLDLSHKDYTVYYEFLDGLLWLNLDAGFTLRDFDGSVSVGSESSNLSVMIPMGYVSAYATLPGTTIAVGGEIKTLSIGDSSISDTTIKVKYETPFLVGVEGGYRTMNIDLVDISGTDVNSVNSGFFIGAFVDF